MAALKSLKDQPKITPAMIVHGLNLCPIKFENGLAGVSPDSLEFLTALEPCLEKVQGEAIIEIAVVVKDPSADPSAIALGLKRAILLQKMLEKSGKNNIRWSPKAAAPVQGENWAVEFRLQP